MWPYVTRIGRSRIRYKGFRSTQAPLKYRAKAAGSVGQPIMPPRAQSYHKPPQHLDSQHHLAGCSRRSTHRNLNLGFDKADVAAQPRQGVKQTIVERQDRAYPTSCRDIVHSRRSLTTEPKSLPSAQTFAGWTALATPTLDRTLPRGPINAWPFWTLRRRHGWLRHEHAGAPRATGAHCSGQRRDRQGTSSY